MRKDTEIEDRIRKIIVNEIGINIDSERLKTDTLLSDIGMDSMNSLDLIMAIEEKFNILFEDNDLIIDNFKNIGSLISYVKKRKKRK